MSSSDTKISGNMKGKQSINLALANSLPKPFVPSCVEQFSHPLFRPKRAGVRGEVIRYYYPLWQWQVTHKVSRACNSASNSPSKTRAEYCTLVPNCYMCFGNPW